MIKIQYCTAKAKKQYGNQKLGHPTDAIILKTI